MTQTFPIALFQHPLLLALRVFHVLFGTDRKPFHCFSTWILALMKEALHQIIGRCSELASSVHALGITVSPLPSDPQTPSPWGTFSRMDRGSVR